MKRSWLLIGTTLTKLYTKALPHVQAYLCAIDATSTCGQPVRRLMMGVHTLFLLVLGQVLELVMSPAGTQV